MRVLDSTSRINNTINNKVIKFIINAVFLSLFAHEKIFTIVVK